MMTIQQFKQTEVGAMVDLPPMIIEEILRLSAKHRIDLNTGRKLYEDTYLVGEWRTGLTITADKNKARFNG